MADTPIERLEAYDQELLGVHELAEVLGHAKQTVSNAYRRESTTIPKPTTRLRMGPIWTKKDVHKFLSATH